MYAQVDKRKENKSRASNSVDQMRSDSITIRRCGENSIFQFVDNRIETIKQQKLKEIANDMTQSNHIAQFQAVNSGQQKFAYVPIRPIQNKIVYNFPVQREGFTHEELITKIQNELGRGICNALTAAWLAGQLNASSVDNTTGVTDANWENIVVLKKLLDGVVAKQPEADSSDISRAFLPYLQSKGQGWFDKLGGATLDDEIQDFSDWIDESYEASRVLIMKHVKKNYHDLDEATVGGIIEDALEEHFNLGTPFTGIVVIKATNTNTNESFGHEFAISHTPSPDYSRNLFRIFDQNSGLTEFVITADDDIIDKLTDYIRKGYVTNPISNSNLADIEITLDFS